MRYSLTATGSASVTSSHFWACLLCWFLRTKLPLGLGGGNTIPGRSHTIKFEDPPKHLGKHLEKIRFVVICASRKLSRTRLGLELDPHATVDNQGHGIDGIRTQYKSPRDLARRNLSKFFH